MARTEGFITLLTAAMLQRLIKAQPSLVVNIGSVLDDWGCAYEAP